MKFISYFCSMMRTISLFFQFNEFIRQQVSEGRGRLHPNMDAEVIMKQMFRSQDKNRDDMITVNELSLQSEDTPEHDEL